jgi:hypothetical protein
MMRLLETLARVEGIDNSSLVPLLEKQRYQLAWGTTLIVITGGAEEVLLDQLYQARRGGQNAILILVGRGAAGDEVHRRARIFDIPVYSIGTERDLRIWMQETRHV